MRLCEFLLGPVRHLLATNETRFPAQVAKCQWRGHRPSPGVNAEGPIHSALKIPFCQQQQHLADIQGAIILCQAYLELAPLLELWLRGYLAQER